MENYPPPQIDIFPRPDNDFTTPHWREPWYRSSRFIIFSVVFLLCLLISQIYNFSRPAVYRSSATLLTVSKTLADQPSAEADIQHVTIQKQLLQGSELLAATARKLEKTENIYLSVPEIRQILKVETITDTNLVEMFAQGTSPEILPLLINTWIDIYLEARSEDMNQTTGTTYQIIKDELDTLGEKIDLKRAELDRFRITHGISSTERVENQALARLNGLTESLNLASEEEVKARARLDAINRGLARGQAFVPQEDQRTISALETRAQELREQLAEMQRRFTQDYIQLQPSLKFIPLELEKLETRIQKLRKQGQNIVQAEAEQAYNAARQSVATIRNQLNAHKQKASEFSSRFAEHVALKTDLEGLELLYRETQERLIKLDAKQPAKYPQVDVIDRAYLPRDPISPNYRRDAFIFLGGSFLLGLLSIWVIEFLNRKPKHPEAFAVPGVHIHNQTVTQGLDQPHSRPSLEQQNHAALESPLEKEISVENLHKIYLSSSLKGKQLLVLLLSGLTLDEATMLKADDFDYPSDCLSITGANPRLIPINTAMHSIFEYSTPCPLWASNCDTTAKELAALLICLAADSGITEPNEFTADAIRHNYIIYLVKQGLRLQDLEQIVGHINSVVLSQYRRYSPQKLAKTVSEINLLHPALANIG